MNRTGAARWWRAFATAAVSAALAALAAPAWAAGQWTLGRIEVRGAAADRVQLEITEPGATSANTVWVAAKARLLEGTTLRVPEGSIVELESPNGQKIRSAAPGGTLLLRSAGERGESYAVLAGRWAFNVLKRLDFFNVATQTVSAQTRATAFTAELDTAAGVARYAVQDGRIEIRHPVLARIGPPGTGQREALLAARETLDAGAPAKSFPLTAESYLIEFGSYGDAQAHFEARLRAAEQAGDADAAVDMRIALGDVLGVLGRSAEAMPVYARALEGLQGPADGYWRAVLLGRMGNVAYRLGDHAEAIRRYEESMRLHESLPALEGEFTVEEQAANLAGAYVADGTYRCAAQFGQRLLERLQSRYAGANHPAFVGFRSALGSAAYGLGDFVRARDHHAEALAIARRLHAPLRRPDGLVYHDEVAQAMNALGWDQSALRRFNEAQVTHRGALAIADALFSTPHALQADARHGLAIVQLGRGRAAEAVDGHRRALQILAGAPRDPIRLGLGRLYLGEALIGARRPADAVQALEQARAALMEKRPDEVHPDLVTLHRDRAAAYRAWGGRAAAAAAAEARANELAQKVQQREAACLR